MKTPSKSLYRVCRVIDAANQRQVMMCYASSMESAKRQWVEEFDPAPESFYHQDPDEFGRMFLAAFPATFEQICNSRRVVK